MIANSHCYCSLLSEFITSFASDLTITLVDWVLECENSSTLKSFPVLFVCNPRSPNSAYFIFNMYQTTSPDNIPSSSSVRKPTSHFKSIIEDQIHSNGIENGRIPSSNYNNTCTSTTTPSCEGNGMTSKSPPKIQEEHQPQQRNYQSNTPISSINDTPSKNPSSQSGGDVLLQWGQRKRSRFSRAEKHHIMPPPPPPSRVRSNSLLCGKDSSEFLLSKNMEDRMAPATASPARHGGAGGAASRPVARSTIGKIEKKASASGQARKVKSDDSSGQSNHTESGMPAVVSEAENGGCTVAGEAAEKGGNWEWPRIYIALSRKEKEDDFYAMKGTKLPHRPKKRAKAVDRALQYCFPGLWLSDLTRARYEVRERKSKKPKRRGLKGLENSMDSDTE